MRSVYKPCLRVIFTLLMLMLLIQVLPAYVFAKDISAVTTDAVHLRSGPGTDKASVSVVAAGTAVTITEKTNSTWYAVTLSNGKTGYIYAKYLKESASAIPGVTTTYVNLRSGAGSGYSSAGVIASGTKLTVTDRSNPQWYGVKLSDGRTGYIFSSYIELTEKAKLTVTTQPKTTYTKSGSKAKAEVKATGDGLTYTWYIKNKGSSKYSKSSITKSTYSVTMNSKAKDRSLYCVVKDKYGNKVQTQTVMLRMAATVTTQPKTTYTKSGSKAKVEVKATGDGLTYTWYIKNKGASKYSKSSITKSTYSVAMSSKAKDRSLYCVVKDKYGNKVQTKTVVLRMAATVTTQPKTTYTKSGSKAKAEVKATGDGLTYTWYIKNKGSSKYLKSSITKSTYSVTMNSKAKDRSLYCVVKDKYGYKVQTETVVLRMAAESTAKPTASPKPTAKPTAAPTAKPTAKPTAAPTVKPTAKPNAEVIMRTTASVNLRKGAGTSYARVKILEKNTEVTALAFAQNGWYKVCLADGTVGYLIDDYLKTVSGDPKTLPDDESSGNTGSTVSPDNSVTEEAPSEAEYVRTTVNDLNLRAGAGTGYARVRMLNSGTVLEVLARTDNGWLKVRMTDGTEGYVSASYTSVYDPSSDNAALPQGDVSMAQYMTMYLDADTSGTVYWSSSDTSVATVDAGSGSQVFIYGVKPGTAEVVAKNASGKVLTKKSVTVTAAEAVRFAYTTPNIISAGVPFELKAVTDDAKGTIKFDIVGEGTYKTKNHVEESNGDNRVRVFSKQVTLDKPGTYTVRAYSNSGKGYSTTYREFEILVVSTTDRVTTSNESRRISDDMLYAVAQFEGYRPEVYADTLAGNIPTVGYGYVVEENTTFYNGLTETEAWAMLADTLNRRGYTTQLNKFIADNKIKMNQQQFDALVSFSYNVGSGYWNSSSKCYLRTILKDNTFAMPKDLSTKNPLDGKVSASEIMMYAKHDGGSSIVQKLQMNQKVKIVSFYRNEDTAEAWYKVTVGENTGWVRSGDITITNTKGLVRDLAYVDAYTFCSNLLDWHRAGGRCIAGLQTRRLAEGKVFSHGNYAEAVKGSKNYKTNTYGYALPDCM